MGDELGALGSDAATDCCKQSGVAGIVARAAVETLLGVVDAADGCKPSEAEGRPVRPEHPGIDMSLSVGV